MAKTTYDRVSEIQMLVQIAERYLHHNQSNEQLKLTLSLVTIARGSCSMVIRPNGKHGITPFGKLHIPKDRAVMSAEASISESDFASFSDKLCHPAPRPITAIIKLDQTLLIDNNGFLFIEEPITADITDIYWVLPLR